ncbi:hypothetical protein TNCV_1365821 [Trichonephila clavipes]|nr:hypothetical protein TNCV_1365821 [Trichonephila clavipes]
MKIPAQLSTNWENFRFLLKNKPLPPSAVSPAMSISTLRLVGLEKISPKHLWLLQNPNLKPHLLNYLQIFAPKFATEIGDGDFSKDLETLLLKMNFVLSVTRSPVISNTSAVQEYRLIEY